MPYKKFDVFETIIDMNRFVQKVFIKKHSFGDTSNVDVTLKTEIKPQVSDRFNTPSH